MSNTDTQVNPHARTVDSAGQNVPHLALVGRQVEPSQDHKIFRTMMRQLIDVCHANQRHLACLREENVNLRSQVPVLVARAPQAQQGPEFLPGVPPPRPDVPLIPTEKRRVARQQGRQSFSQSQQSRIC